MDHLRTIQKTIILFTLLSAPLFLTGCSSWNPQGTTDMPPIEGVENAPPLSATIDGYDDIELPIEMKSEKDMAIRTESFNGGIHEYAGSVDIKSLRDFIVVSMGNNNWKLVGEGYYDKVMLAFVKPNQTCMVVLYNGAGGYLGKTYANYYITADLSADSPKESIVK